VKTKLGDEQNQMKSMMLMYLHELILADWVKIRQILEYQAEVKIRL